MRTVLGLVTLLGTTLAFSAMQGCSSDSSDPAADAGTGDSASGAFVSPSDPGKGGFLVTVSGEDLAVVGYEWAAGALAEADPPAFVDGWAISFDHTIVTVDKIRVNADPDKDDANPTNMGALVASADGPWVVDTTVGGSITGKSGEPDEKTVAIAAFAKKSDGSAFDPASRYGFSYDFVTANAAAKNVNLDAAGLALYETAKQKGWSMILSGTATYKGPAPQADTVFAKIPKTVKFTLGLKNPSTYANCRNADLQKDGDEFPRGIQSDANKSTVVQITLHTDHTFWNKLNVEGTPLSFDAIAANASTYGTADSTGIVSTDELDSVDITAFKTKAGEVLPGRSLVSDYTAPSGQLRFDPNGTSFAKANSFSSFLSYSAAAGGHLNADGECEVKNNFTP